MKELKQLLGKPIQSSETRMFFEKNDIKYPKRDVISSKSSNDSFFVIQKKKGIELYYEIQIYNPKYPPVLDRTKKKGMYIPMLSYVIIYPKTEIELPYKLHSKMAINDIEKRFGAFEQNNRSGIFFINTLIDKKRDIVFSAKSKDKETISSMVLEINAPASPLFLIYETLENVVTINKAVQSNAIKSLNWIIKNNYFKAENNLVKEGIAKIKIDKIDVFEFCKNYLNRGYILETDLLISKKTIAEYNKNDSYRFSKLCHNINRIPEVFETANDGK